MPPRFRGSSPHMGIDHSRPTTSWTHTPGTLTKQDTSSSVGLVGMTGPKGPIFSGLSGARSCRTAVDPLRHIQGVGILQCAWEQVLWEPLIGHRSQETIYGGRSDGG